MAAAPEAQSRSETISPPPPPVITAIHHLKLPTSSIAAAFHFYTHILNFTPLPHLDHFTSPPPSLSSPSPSPPASSSNSSVSSVPQKHLFAALVLHAPSQTIVEFRYHPEQAAKQKGWDPITWAVSKKADLERWGAWVDERGEGRVKRSRVLSGLKSWWMGIEDPDGRIVRLYVADEEHEWLDPSQLDHDEYWMAPIVGDPAVALGVGSLGLNGGKGEVQE